MIQASIAKQLRDFELNVSLDCPDAGCVALVGPTGCGKTTTLRILAGLERPDAGRVEMDGAVLVDAGRGIWTPPQERRLGVVFQDYALFPHMSALANVMYGPRSRGMGKREARDAARQALELVRMEKWASHKPTRLSGGQQQRVAVARAIASGARALLMDEPLSALDADTRRHVRGELKRLIADIGLQTVIVTHDVVDALSLADTICVMSQGQVAQAGDRASLITRPRSEFVAEFVGVNLVPCTARPAEDGLCAVDCGGTTFYSLDEAEGEAFMSCNPWDISLSARAPEGSALNVLYGTVVDLSHFGGRTRVRVQNGIALTAEITHASEGLLGLQIGSKIYAHFKASATRVYT